MSAGRPSLARRLVRLGLWSALALAVLVPSLVVGSWLLWARDVEPQPPFRPLPLALATFDIYDLGIVDADGDGHLDIFTTNHDARQSLLLGDGQGGFVDALSAIGLDQDAAFPGLADGPTGPAIDTPGLYVFFQDRGLYLVVHEPAPNWTIAGTIEASLPVTLAPEPGPAGGIVAEAVRLPAEIGSSTTEVVFSAAASGRLRLQFPSNAMPITVTLEPSLPLDHVFVGTQHVNPEAHRFTLGLRDRHGMAWNDLTDDGRLDLFISRGGLFGWMERLPDVFSDELLLARPAGGFAELARARGFEKRGCSGRQAAWVDVDNDGLLDLYIACGRGAGGFWDYVPPRLRPLLGGGNFRDQNQLWRQTADGRFAEVGEALGLDFPAEGTFVWLDVANNGWMDLLWASEDGIFLYRNEGGTFTGEELQPQPTTPVRRLLVADTDRNGYLDIFAVAAIGSRLLINDGGSLTSIDPGERGLPSGARTGSWVDFDNDGRIDFYAWPDGLFRQQPDGSFAAVHRAGMPSPYWWLVDPRVAWFDLDNDGRRDLLLAQRWFPFALQTAQPELFPFWSALFKNELETSGHWLQVELIGGKGNRPAIGAQVELASSHGTELQQVGQADSAHFSQGHYRLYFGLGDDDRPERLTVRWPDGHIDTLERPAVDRLLRLQRHPEDDYLARRDAALLLVDAGGS